MAFADAVDLVTFTGDDSLAGAKGDLLLEQASAVIRNHCRQTFDLVTDDEVDLRGTWSHRLKLPERPVVSVSSVEIDDVEVATYRLVRDTLVRTGPLQTMFGVRDGGRSWGGPSYTVTVTYTHGFATGTQAMETVKGVCLQVAARAAVNPRSMTQESIGDWSGSYASASGGFALTAAEQAILDRFTHERAA